jgi:redox-sensitive bicupin YhaK (pirin superfamily)
MIDTGAVERRVCALAEIHRGAGFRSRKLVTELGDPLDPFLSIEHFHMSAPTFEPHPHAGLSAITYLFERSEGALVSREGSGEAKRIDPGAVRWQETGRGIVHVESPLTPGRDCHGLQVLLNLPEADKQAAPRVFHLEAHEIPTAELDPWTRVRVVCGAAGGVRSPIAPRAPVTLLDVHLAPGASLAYALDADAVAFVVGLEGGGEVGPRGAAVSIAADTATAFDAGEGVEARAGEAGFHFLIAAGRPLREPVLFEGPLALGSREAIDRTWARFAAGELGRVAPPPR